MISYIVSNQITSHHVESYQITSCRIIWGMPSILLSFLLTSALSNHSTLTNLISLIDPILFIITAIFSHNTSHFAYSAFCILYCEGWPLLRSCGHYHPWRYNRRNNWSGNWRRNGLQYCLCRWVSYVRCDTTCTFAIMHCVFIALCSIVLYRIALNLIMLYCTVQHRVML